MLEERFQSSAEKAYIASLDNALTIILGKLAKIESVDEVKRLNALKALIEKEISGLYEDMKPYVKEDMADFAQFDYKTQFNYLNETASLGYTFAAIPKDTMKQILSFDDVMVLNGKGYTLNELFNKASNAQISKYKEIISGGLGANDGYSNIAKSLKEAGASATLDMRTLVQTAVGKARDKANIYTYDNVFADVIIGWKSVATLDSSTTVLCAELDGAKYMKPKYSYSTIPNRPKRHFNCLDGDTLVSTRYPISYISKRAYKGDIYTIRTAMGNSIKCTPNHPILTNRGFVNAQFINKFDKIATDFTAKKLRFSDVQNNDGVSTIENLFSSLWKSKNVTSVTMPLSTEDFHGDVTDNKVDVIFINRELCFKGYSAINQSRLKNFFIKASSFTSRLCHFDTCAMFLRNSFSGIMTRLNLLKSFFFIHNRPFFNFLLGLRSKFNSLSFKLASHFSNRYIKSISNTSKTNSVVVQCDSTLENKNAITPKLEVKRYSIGLNNISSYDIWVDMKLARNISDGTLGDKVLFDDIIDIVIDNNVSTHVYNLENDLHYYTANNLITHNCRSILRPLTKFDTKTTRPENGDNTGQIDSDITFKDWFTTQSTQFQKDYLGEARYKLYKEERLSIKSFVDVKDGRRFTIKELNEKF